MTGRRLPHLDAQPDDHVSGAGRRGDARRATTGGGVRDERNLSGEGDAGSLRAVATADGVPTIAVETGRTHRFQPALIDRAVDGVESVLAEHGGSGGARRAVLAQVMGVAEERRWLRADSGGPVGMRWGPEPLVDEGETICTVTDHFRHAEHVVEAPFAGLIAGVPEIPVASPGHPPCHLVRISDGTRAETGREIRRGEFLGYRAYGQRWMTDDEAAE